MVSSRITVGWCYRCRMRRTLMPPTFMKLTTHQPLSQKEQRNEQAFSVPKGENPYLIQKTDLSQADLRTHPGRKWITSVLTQRSGILQDEWALSLKGRESRLEALATQRHRGITQSSQIHILRRAPGRGYFLSWAVFSGTGSGCVSNSSREKRMVRTKLSP